MARPPLWVECSKGFQSLNPGLIFGHQKDAIFLPEIVKFIVRKYIGRCQVLGVAVGREDRELEFNRGRVSV